MLEKILCAIHLKFSLIIEFVMGTSDEFFNGFTDERLVFKNQLCFHTTNKLCTIEFFISTFFQPINYFKLVYIFFGIFFHLILQGFIFIFSFKFLWDLGDLCIKLQYILHVIFIPVYRIICRDIAINRFEKNILWEFFFLFNFLIGRYWWNSLNLKLST